MQKDEKPMQPESPLLTFDSMISKLKQHCEWLNKFHQIGMKPLNHFRYPTRALIVVYQKICKKMQPRKKFDPPVINDILLMECVELVLVLVTAKKYLIESKPKKPSSEMKQITDQLSLSQQDQQSLMQIPIVYIESGFTQVIQEYHSKMLGQSTERESIGRFLKWYNTIIKDIDRYIFLPPDVMRKEIVLSQYPLDSRNLKVQQQFGWKLSFIGKLKKRAAIAEKNLNKRKMKILELIDGEKRYIDKLKDYISYIKEPIEKLGCLSTEQKVKIFSNVVPIKQFHEMLCERLEQQFQKYSKYQCYGDLIKKNLPFFKLYIDYILNVNAGSQADFIMLQETNQDIHEISRKFLEEKEKKASDQLTEPTFRIARYEALFGEIIKKTNPTHPDYKKMEEALKGFRSILGGVNQTVDKIIRRNKLNQLDEEFGTVDSPIFEERRQFLSQFTMLLMRQDRLENVILYIFTDLILIVDRTSRKISKRIIVDDKYYVRREEDNKIYKNVIKIHSDGFINISAGVEERHQKKIDQVFQVLEGISIEDQNSEAMVYVQVLGTEEIGSTSFAKHTEYVVEVKFLGLKKLLYLRFSAMSSIIKAMQEFYNSNLGITEQQTLKKTWFNNHKSKTIQDRKRTIQQLMQKLFNHDLIRKKPEYLFTNMGLDPDFFLTARKSWQKSVILINESKLTQSKLSRYQQRQAMLILCATEIKLGRDIYHDFDEVAKKKQRYQTKIKVTIHTMSNQPPNTILISQASTVQDACNKISKLIGLRTNRDFRLFHQIGKKELRVLDHEQQMMKIFKFSEEEASGGILQDVATSVKKFFSPESMPTLIFKKYYFLPFETEQAQFRRDLTRLRLLVYQVFAEVQDMKYQLTFDQYLLFLAMLVFIEIEGAIDKEIDPDIVHTIIPETIFKLKNYTEKQWLEKSKIHLTRLDTEIKKIIEHNRNQLKHSRIKVDTVSKTALYFGARHLCSQIVLNKIRSNPIYGSNLFYVQPYKSTYDNLLKEGLKMAYNMWLAIKVQSLTLLTPSSKQTVLQLHYKDIQKINVYSQAIVFKMDDLINREYRLNTYQSFQISQLVKYNKTLNDVLSDLTMDSALISKTKLYKEDLLDYRYTDQQLEVSVINGGNR